MNMTKIKTSFSLPIGYEDIYAHYITSIEALIAKVTTPIFYDSTLSHLSHEEFLNVCFTRLHEQTPFISHSPCDKDHTNISITLICSAHHTHGVGRFMCDLYSRWVIPGKQVPIVNTRSIAFKFEMDPYQRDYYLSEIILNITDLNDIPLINTNLTVLSKELKLDILAVQHARHVISLKPLSLEQKKLLIQENIASLLDRSSKDMEPSILEYMHQLITKCFAEDKCSQIKDQITPLLNLKPTAFDRDIYSELHQFVSQLKDSFTISHDVRHLNRIVSYHYIFRKIIKNAIQTDPEKRHISIKTLHTQLHLETSCHPVIAVLVCMNFLNDHEIFEEKHLLNAIQSIVINCMMVPNSCIIDRRGPKRIRSVYLEIEKHDHSAFTSLEIKELKKKLHAEVKNRIEGLLHPVFAHRNEEEIMKDILDLSKQLKYIHDLPQVIVNFHKQTSFEVSFIIILLRLNRSKGLPLKELFQQSSTILKLYNYDMKAVGTLRKRYPKEAHVLEVRLDKKQFLRKDFSLDLYKARLCVVSEITRLLGDVRDYNGGMIAKQYETLSALKALLLEDNIHNDFLLENFFYSLTPNYMQSILSPVLLKKSFLMLLAILEHEFNKDLFFINSSIHEDYYILMLGALNPSFKELINDLIDNLLTSSHDICHSWVNIYDITCIGFLLHYENQNEYQHFYDTIFTTMKQWEKSIKEHQEEVSSLSFLNELIDHHG